MTDAERVEFIQEWYAVRLERLRDLIQDKAPQLEDEICAILANGSANSAEPPTYAQILNQKTYRIAELEKVCRAFLARYNNHLVNADWLFGDIADQVRKTVPKGNNND